MSLQPRCDALLMEGMQAGQVQQLVSSSIISLADHTRATANKQQQQDKRELASSQSLVFMISRVLGQRTSSIGPTPQAVLRAARW